MIPRIHTIVNASYLALLIDKNTDAGSIARPWTVASAIGDAESVVRIAQQRKIEVVLFRECRVIFNRIEASPQNDNVVLREIV